MRHKGCMLMAVLALFVGWVAPVWAFNTADPLEEHYFAHVLPFYKVDAGWLSFAVFADTSFQQPAVGCPAGRDTPCSARIHLFFFKQDCSLVIDKDVFYTANGVQVRLLNNFAGIPPEGVVFADTGIFSNGQFTRFLAYIVLLNPADNTMTRIDSIPFSPGSTFPGAVQNGIPAHWTRYDAFNTTAITIGDSTLTAALEPRTTLMLFNALGGGVTGATGAPEIIGSANSLREFMLAYGRPRSVANGSAPPCVIGPCPGPGGGDWVTTGFSSTSDVKAGTVVLDAFDGDENFLGSVRIEPQCFERFRLGALDKIPSLASHTTTCPGSICLGHVVAFSLPDGQRIGSQSCGGVPGAPPGLSGRCSFSGFQETVVEAGPVDLIFSGYMHHSSQDDVSNSNLPAPLDSTTRKPLP